jgi:hypothetical protein
LLHSLSVASFLFTCFSLYIEGARKNRYYLGQGMRVMKKWPLLLVTSTCALLSVDNAHFYRANNLFQEPRFERALLNTLDISLGGGGTDKSRNSHHHIVPLLDIYGPSNMHELGIGVPGKNLANQEDLTLVLLSHLPSRNCFATFSIHGHFQIIESNISLIQNASKGFFAQMYLPIRHLAIDNICFQDLSPTDDICPNINTPIWQTFLCLFDKILCTHGLSKECFKGTGVGDLSLLIGWALNHENTEILDYVDVTFKAGILLPTGKKKNEDKIFSLPFGYDGHFGVPLSADLGIGLYEWLTVGGHIDAIFFADITRKMRIKTGLFQSGLIKLAKAEVKISRGALWDAGLFIKADHIYRRLSLVCGYSFAQQNNDSVCPCDCCFDASIANTDEMLKGWNQSTIHFLVEYDFMKENARSGARVGAFFNWQISGKQVFKTNVGGGSIGFDVILNF